MDFGWVSNFPSEEKHPHHSRNPLGASLTPSPTKTSEQLAHDYGQYAADSASMGFLHAPIGSESPQRRTRADTMPTTTAVIPYPSDMYNSFALTCQMRHRSGSVTLPFGPFHDGSVLYGSSLFGSYNSTSPIDDNASSTVASTLASLGLDDENSPTRLLSSSATSFSGPTATSFSMFRESASVTTNGDGQIRNRAYTVTGRPCSPTNSSDYSRLAPSNASFSPFSPESHNSALQRPRAISMGVMDGQPADRVCGVGHQGYGRHDRSNTSYSLLSPSAARLSSQSTGRSEPQRNLRTARSSGSLSYSGLGAHDPLATLPETAVPQTLYHSPVESNKRLSLSCLGGLPASPPTTSAQMPSRALWLGNINPALSVSDLTRLFSGYGQIESTRILSDKECAFVNFYSVEAAVAAKADLETRLGSMLGGTPVRVGFGKADVSAAMALTSDAGPNAQGPTRALWVGNIPASINPAVLRSIFQPFGAIESVRVLSHKNCGFVNFEHQEDAVWARKALQNKEILGPGTDAVRIGFAKVPAHSSDESQDTEAPSQQPVHLDGYASTHWTATMAKTHDQPSDVQPDVHVASAEDRLAIMKQLGCSVSCEKGDRDPLMYRTTAPELPPVNTDRKIEPLKLREWRKQLDHHEVSADKVQDMAIECRDEIVELCIDYIGNTVVQKIVEHSSEETRQMLLTRIAPYLASVGMHKNGTWAAQKVVDHANTPHQVQLIQEHLAPYVPLLLLDQFGNYVVQCCLHMGAEHDQFIFDAIVDKCWEIGQGRFGARSVRAILENPLVTREQQIYVAAAIVQHAALLTTNANGALLLVWYLDTFDAPGRFRVLCPRILPCLSTLCTHKLGSMTVYRLVSQDTEPEARHLVLKSIFNDNRLLEHVLKDMVHGVPLIQKMMNLPKLAMRKDISRRVKECLHRLHTQHVPGYRKLWSDVENIPYTTGDDSLLNDMSSVHDDLVNPPSRLPTPPVTTEASNVPPTLAVMTNMYTAAMTAASTNQQPHRPTQLGVDVTPFDQLLKDLLRPLEEPRLSKHSALSKK